MRRDACNGAWKVWLFAATSIVLGAWVSPLIYNAGKALAEATFNKPINGPIERLATICRAADFPDFFRITVWFSAFLLIWPWMKWIQAKQTSSPEDMKSLWNACPLNRPKEITGDGGLLKKRWGPWEGILGFTMMAGLFVLLEITLIPAGYFSIVMPSGGITPVVLGVLTGVILPATIMELFFRGLSMNLFLRAMPPLAAITMSAAFFAITLSLIPPSHLKVVDLEAAGIGFELLDHSIARFC